jgi:RND family efflux transporter MFP subunit
MLVAAMAGAGYYYWKKANKPPSLGKTVTVKRGMIRSLVQATGSVAAVNAVDISSKITGRIVEVSVAENDFVTVGQVLIVLDDSHYRAVAEQAAARLDTRRRDFVRLQNLAAAGAIPLKELDTARMEWQVAEADYAIALTQVKDTVIRAPVSGTVIGKPIPAGQTVSPGLSSPLVLMSVADVSCLELQVQVDEADIGKIQSGQKVGFMIDAVPEKMFAGKITSISEKANIQQNVVYYPVTIAIDAAAAPLKPGMTVRVTVVTGQKRDVLTIPSQAISVRPDGSFVKVLANGQPQDVKITKGLIGPDRVEVTSGLKEGDQVVLPPGATGGMMGLPRMGPPGAGHH